MLARGRLMVISSRMEGGANVASEALAHGVPVIASRISGNIGMLGKDYAGYYAPGNERALARLLWRAESDAEYLPASAGAMPRAAAPGYGCARAGEPAAAARRIARYKTNRQDAENAKRTRMKSRRTAARRIRS